MGISGFFDVNNTLIVIPIGAEGYAMPWIEAIAVIAGLLCIWLASKEIIMNFLFGLISVALFAVIFYQFQLYALLLLQVFFFAANIYGWFAWARPTSFGSSLRIRWLSPALLTIWSVLSIVAIGLMTVYIDGVFATFAYWTVHFLNFFGASIHDLSLQSEAFPFWGSCVAVLSVLAQILMTRKYVENWILWTVVNIISIGIYYTQGLYVMAIQYGIFLCLSINGTKEWMALAKRSRRFIFLPSSL